MARRRGRPRPLPREGRLNRARSAAAAWTAAALALATVFPHRPARPEAARSSRCARASGDGAAKDPRPGRGHRARRPGAQGARLRPRPTSSCGCRPGPRRSPVRLRGRQAVHRRDRDDAGRGGPAGLDDSIRQYSRCAAGLAGRHRPPALLTSGVVNYGEEDLDYRRDFIATTVHAAYRLGLDFSPGSRWSYSNTGWCCRRAGRKRHRPLLRRHAEGARLRTARNQRRRA